jgi:hypothetical protein
MCRAPLLWVLLAFIHELGCSSQLRQVLRTLMATQLGMTRRSEGDLGERESDVIREFESTRSRLI